MLLDVYARASEKILTGESERKWEKWKIDVGLRRTKEKKSFCIFSRPPTTQIVLKGLPVIFTANELNWGALTKVLSLILKF